MRSVPALIIAALRATALATKTGGCATLVSSWGRQTSLRLRNAKAQARSEPHTAPSTLAHAASACANVLSRVSNPRCRVWLRSKRCRSCRLPSNEPPRRVEGTLRPRSRQPPPGPSHELAAHFFRNLKTICELSRQRKLSRECGPPPYSKGEGFLLDSQMWMPNKNAECLPGDPVHSQAYLQTHVWFYSAGVEGR